MTNVERMSNDENPNDEAIDYPFRASSFWLRHSLDIRPSAFVISVVIRHSGFVIL
jgi:hypothetical protein